MLTITVNPDRVIKNLQTHVRRKIPGAIAKGLTRVAYDVRDDETSDLPKYLDRPTPFTRRGFAIVKANTRTMTSKVYIRPIQRNYLRWQIEGGTTGKPKVVPARTWPTNNYGNLPRNATKGANVYRSTTKYGRPAYFKAKGGKRNRRLDYIGFIPATRSYSPRFPFYRIGKRSARSNYRRQIRREVRRVLE